MILAFINNKSRGNYSGRMVVCKVHVHVANFFNTFQIAPNCCKTSIAKLHIIMLLISLSHGLRKFGLLPEKILFLTLLKRATYGNIFLDFFFEAKNEEILLFF